MHILLLEIDIHLPASQSLKDKRGILKSVIHRLRTTYNVSVAEVDGQDKWQVATLAIVTVSSLRNRVEETERKVLAEVEQRFDLVITGVDKEWL